MPLSRPCSMLTVARSERRAAPAKCCIGSKQAQLCSPNHLIGFDSVAKLGYCACARPLCVICWRENSCSKEAVISICCSCKGHLGLAPVGALGRKRSGPPPAAPLWPPQLAGQWRALSGPGAPTNCVPSRNKPERR